MYMELHAYLHISNRRPWRRNHACATRVDRERRKEAGLLRGGSAEETEVRACVLALVLAVRTGLAKARRIRIDLWLTWAVRMSSRLSWGVGGQGGGVSSVVRHHGRALTKMHSEPLPRGCGRREESTVNPPESTVCTFQGLQWDASIERQTVGLDWTRREVNNFDGVCRNAKGGGIYTVVVRMMAVGSCNS